MKSSIALFLLIGLTSTVMAAPSKIDDHEMTNEDISPAAFPHLQESHSRVLRNVDKTNGFSLLAIGVFGAFVKYMAYHFISKNAEGGGEKRSIDDTILDLTRITSCLSNETEGVLSNFHLHCFFPSYFSRRDNEIISGVIWGSSEKESVELSLVRREGLPELKRRRSRDVSEGEEEMRRLRDFPKAETKTGGAPGLSFLAVAIIGAMAVYSIINRNANEESRGLTSDSADEYIRNANFILQCLHERDFIQSLECLLD
ncbi:uncharacterized protein [Palaemon carinicauda]|uniref:uncharacterized protein n=1 Tax=Palaemon carinicauda TaxID=392227 RepID=UPI0035B5A40B